SALALTAGERADLALGEVGELDPCERVRDGLAVRRPRAPGRPHAAVATGHDDVAHREREVPVDVLGLRHVADDALAACDVGRDAVDRDGAGVRADETGDRLEQRRLARAVHADEAAHPAVPDRERRAVEREHVAVVDGDVADVDGGAHPAPPASAVTTTSTSWRTRSR